MNRFLEWAVQQEQRTPSPLVPLLSRMARAAQKIYDEWDQDPQTGVCDWLGTGGVCQDIADGLIDVIFEAGIDAITVDSGGVGEQHVWVMVDLPGDGVYSVDIPPSVYEVGGGFNWKKIPGVRFDANDIVVSFVDEPGTLDQYTGF